MDKAQGKEIVRAFCRQFFLQVGTIEGGDGTLARLNTVSLSSLVLPKYAASFGCQPNEVALLVLWFSIDAVPANQTPVIFPKTFKGIPVYYKRGGKISAQ